LNAEQDKVLKDAREAVELIDAVGTRLGIVARPPSDAEVEVEFMTGDGRTVGVLTLEATDIRKLDGSEILHARRVSA
jgi:hypothetical protein